ncbi:MAG TPA: BamA/TamA family outer membrane protein, partial [Vicinamibacterales bacterium]|nr:BamA/TamA family outer membrane protein [Vicinamibacterales bacterium]
LAAPAFTHVYKESLGSLWRDYEASLTAQVAAAAPDPSITRLTHQGFTISGARFDAFSCAGCAPDLGTRSSHSDIIYSAVGADGFPAIYRLSGGAGAPRRVTTRFLGSTIGLGRDRIYFDQVELRRNAGLYSDLYAFSRGDGRVHRLTSEARVLDPDLSPDGETLACVQNRPGQRDLVLVQLNSGFKLRVLTPTSFRSDDRTPPPSITTLIAEPGTQFDGPKWSPDGRTIAVERHRLGGAPEIVLVDVATLAVRVVASAPRTRFVTPAWRPDGAAIVAAVAPDNETFNLFEIAVDGSKIRQLTHTTGGATWPDVSSDGKTIVFTGYTTDGDDLFSMPYPATGAEVEMQKPPANQNPRPTSDNPPLASAHSYSPLDTLRPTSWTPVVATTSDQIRVGAGTSGYDVLGYHAYAATATWLLSGPAGAPTPSAATPDWQLYYLYERWRPTFYVSAASDTSFFAGPATDAGTPTAATRRERQIEGGVIVPINHARVQHAARASLVRAAADYTLGDSSFSRDLTAVRLSWHTNTARVYGYSISSEDGLTVGATAEIVRRGLGSVANATTTTADARAYLSGLAPHHVIALRLAGGVSNGDATVGRTFLLGGASPGAGVVDLGSGAFALLRGFSPDTFAGSHAAVANAEYRWPIARPQRGHDTWPLFLHTIHAAVFADAGNAWTGAFDRRAIKSSAGAQLSADLVAGFFAPFTVSAGAAWGHDGSQRVDDGVTAYFRVGKAF